MNLKFDRENWMMGGGLQWSNCLLENLSKGNLNFFLKWRWSQISNTRILSVLSGVAPREHRGCLYMSSWKIKAWIASYLVGIWSCVSHSHNYFWLVIHSYNNRRKWAVLELECSVSNHSRHCSWNTVSTWRCTFENCSSRYQGKQYSPWWQIPAKNWRFWVGQVLPWRSSLSQHHCCRDFVSCFIIRPMSLWINCFILMRR